MLPPVTRCTTAPPPKETNQRARPLTHVPALVPQFNGLPPLHLSSARCCGCGRHQPRADQPDRVKGEKRTAQAVTVFDRGGVTYLEGCLHLKCKQPSRPALIFIRTYAAGKGSASAFSPPSLSSCKAFTAYSFLFFLFFFLQAQISDPTGVKEKEMTAQAVTATVSDSTAGTSEEAE